MIGCRRQRRDLLDCKCKISFGSEMDFFVLLCTKWVKIQYAECVSQWSIMIKNKTYSEQKGTITYIFFIMLWKFDILSKREQLFVMKWRNINERKVQMSHSLERCTRHASLKCQIIFLLLFDRKLGQFAGSGWINQTVGCSY